MKTFEHAGYTVTIDEINPDFFVIHRFDDDPSDRHLAGLFLSGTLDQAIEEGKAMAEADGKILAR